ncbi:Rossmann-like and DUF2520 domain-containing protein [Desulfofalx alkaliphila]|uniref:Rossmann-like and DUF2520 domain-containing protein n=1 Tax=Desulfofalx alkaliphila TaxID=105483 RepID=UPI0004E2762C|nr:Rossmann-like and DUF2520 domain-containing protein [Desulfofalx alkaliphila]
MAKPSIAVVGAGKVGSALAVTLQRLGYPLIGVASRNIKTAQALGERLSVKYTDFPAEVTGDAEVVFITTPDRHISATAQLIANEGGFTKGQVVAHTSGSLAASAVGIARSCGAAAAALHPLQAFADVEMAIANLAGSYFAMEGDPEGLAVLQGVVEDLKGKGFIIKEADKPLYHAAAVVASNYLVALIHMATEMLSKMGLDGRQAVEALQPLILGTINNVKSKGTVEALTGPVERGDVVTVEKHLAALEQMEIDVQEAYKRLGIITAHMAENKGTIDKDLARIIKRLLGGDRNND